MSYKDIVAVPISTVGGAGITVAMASGDIFTGFYLNGSGGGTTLTVKNGATTVLSTSAAASALIIVYGQPLAFSSGIVATCSGTGSYTLFVAK